MKKDEEVSYWLKLSDETYSKAMDLLELSDSYYENARKLMKSKRKED